MLRLTGMERKLVTCPETGHLEELELAHTNSGIVILRCSRFPPSGAFGCPRECARRMDRRERIVLMTDSTERVLVLVAGETTTAAAAASLAGLLREDGLTVDLSDAEAAPPPPQDYDAVVIGCGKRFGRGIRAAIAYSAAHRDVLSAMPSFFFCTCPGEATAALARISHATGWQPTASATTDGVHTGDLRRFAIEVADEIPLADAPLAAPDSL
jgi:hypothetical protein